MSSSLGPEQVVALGIFASYFGSILVLFAVILRSIPWRKGRDVILFGGLTVASLVHTWTYMIKFLLWSFTSYESRFVGSAPDTSMSWVERVANWLVNTELFEQAWFAVCDGTFNWLWSEQLCLFTVGAWTVFLYSQSRGGSQVALPWAYMLLGQLVAISVASNLFFLALSVSPRRIPERHSAQSVPIPVWMCVAVGLATVYYSPAVLHSHFMLNLLLMHGAITLPLLPLPKALDFLPLRTSTVYWLIGGASAAIRWQTLSAALASGIYWSSIPSQMWQTLHWHPAQSSIGWDIVWTSVSFLAYQSAALGGIDWSIVTLPLGSVGVAAPIALANAESTYSRSHEKTA
ncbi:hypothetical protein EXIGLDRAFT_730599 [Exidia glandulosa HHB12029]|uniref:Uncharacterized protein n=1 Tax=Exidia glandulosa HHB12029 TaxID=1314781 RepID=A0A165ZDT4_EXIGL|nr:hypothetical protein EXIGLDRAFT_730599 [Exidia glandulosa HHB12029]